MKTQPGSDSRSAGNSPLTSAPAAQAASQRASWAASLTVLQPRPPAGGRSGDAVAQATQSASKSGARPSDARSRQAKLSLTAYARSGARVAWVSAAVASGLRVIAFG